MKINVIRNLILPWIVFFILAIAVIVVVGSQGLLPAKEDPRYIGALAVGIFVCLVFNIRTLQKAGIWIAHSLPSSLRYNKKPWFLRALLAAVITFGFYLMGQLAWMPLFWHAFVIPVVFSITLFVGIWSLMGPILTWASRVNFSRMAAFLVSLPVFALVPLTASFLGQTITQAYVASRPSISSSASTQVAMAEEPTKKTESSDELTPPAELSAEGQVFKNLAEGNQSCSDQNKEILKALNTKAPADVAYWAAKATKCAEMKSVVGLPKLAEVLNHPDPKVRAAAIRAMPRFGSENVKNISYLIVKRINEKEPIEVLDAATYVLSRLGEDEKKWSTNRLKALLDSSGASQAAAKVLINQLKRDDLVVEYVSESLAGTAGDRERAMRMICLLPKAQRGVAEPHIQNVVAMIKTGADEDPAMVALSCLGRSGLQAIREEVVQPKVLEKPVAARALAEMDVQSSPEEALETVDRCVRDSDAQVRKWCSQSLGKIGAPALPKILDLLKSQESELKDAGKNALNFFDDPAAKPALEKVRADNTGWLANKKKLQIAEAVSTALIKIQAEELADQEPAASNH